MIETAFTYLGLLFLGIIIVFTVGRLVSGLFNYECKAKYNRVFFNLLLGLCTIVFVYSIYMARLKTVHVLMILPVIFLFPVFKKRHKTSLNYTDLISGNFVKIFMGDIVALFLLALPFFVYECLFLMKTGDFNFRVPEVDYFFYGNLSESLNLNGRENKFFTSNVLYPETYAGMVPYHYFELWANAFLVKIYSLPSVCALLLITYPLLYLVILTGIVAILENFGTVNSAKIFVCYLLVLLSGIYLHFRGLSLTPPITGPTMSSVLSVFGRKLGPVYIFFIFSLILFIRKQPYGAIIALSLVPTISVGTLPGVMGGIFLFFISNFYHKTFSKKQLALGIFFYLLYLLSYFLLYNFFGTSYTNEYVVNKNLLALILKNPYNTDHYIFLFKGILHSSGVLLVSYSPHFLILSLLLLACKKIHKKNCLPGALFKFGIFVIYALVCGSFAAGLAFGLLDAAQLFNNLYPLFNIWLVSMLIYYFEKTFYVGKKIFSVNINFIIAPLFAGIMACNIWQNVERNRYHCQYFSKYSDKYINSTLRILKNMEGNNIGAYCLGDQDYVEGEYVKSYRERPGYFIQFLPGYRDLIDLYGYKTYDLKDSVAYYDRYYLYNNDFVHFTRQQKAGKNFISYEKSLVGFIEKFEIKYAFVAKNAWLNDGLNNKISFKIMDEKSGETFIVFK